MQDIPKIQHWHSAANPPALRPNGLHLWRIRTGANGLPLSRLWPLLSSRESERARRLCISHHRNRYVRAQAGLRAILSYYIAISPQQIVFKYGPQGKPSLEYTRSSLEFNLTTTGDLALVAVSAEQPIGIDCERVRRRENPTAIARRMFTSEEASQIAGADPDEQLKQFYLAWTALEASVKADGRGLFRRREPVAQGGLQIKHCVPESGYIAAAASMALAPVGDWVALELPPD